MKFLIAVLVVLAMAQSALAGVLFERSLVPAGWTMTSQSPANAPVTFIIALKQRNLEALEAKFWSVSDPDHADYQNYLSAAGINAMVAPSAGEVAVVKSWLLSHGVSPAAIKTYSDAIEVVTSVKRASSLFSAKFFTFTNEKTRRVVNKVWGKYSVPDFVHRVVSFVEGVSTFPMPRYSQFKTPQSPQQNTQIAVPQFTQAIYELPTLQALSNPTFSQGVVEYEGQYFSNNDTLAFNTASNWNVPTVPAANIIGINDPTNPGDEASLDVQFQGALNPTATPWFWIEAGETWVYGWSVHFLNTTSVPQVTSTSYGWWEGDQCDVTNECSTLGVDTTVYVERTNVEFQKIGVLGVSMLISSGDSGANGRTNGDCSIPQLRPAFPASSPYVTSVGATEIRSPVFKLANAPPICSGQGYSCVSSGTEAAVSSAISGYASGGGFSNISSQPSYQTAAVAAYFASGVKLPPASYYNAAGRGHPDVSALGQNGYVIIGGSGSPVSGTSMSSPIFSGVISLLNVEAVTQSGQPLGFLNPLLYKIAASNAAAFHDITLGDNICTEDGCATGCEGFYATKGWDPVTGLGTPNYTELLSSVKAVFAERKAKGL